MTHTSSASKTVAGQWCSSAIAARYKKPVPNTVFLCLLILSVYILCTLYTLYTSLYIQVPKARSGVSLFLHTQDDAVYVYGGYSKEKVAGSLKEGKVHEETYITFFLSPSLTQLSFYLLLLCLFPLICNKVHEDTWILQLKPVLATTGGGSKGGLAALDLSRATWQKVRTLGTVRTVRTVRT
jgi:hypothetical protein